MALLLQEESTEDMEHKDWCEKEMGQNEKARTSHETDVDETQAKVESVESEVGMSGFCKGCTRVCSS